MEDTTFIVNKLLGGFSLNHTTLCGENRFVVIETEAAFMKHNCTNIYCM